MGKKKSYITVTDQFCGAGGSSQGVRNFSRSIGGGVEVHIALNHWKLAIETHNTNFPDTIHDCTDIQACDPRRYPSTDILITSPECTNHSLAKGQKHVKAQLDLFHQGKLDPAAERSRATMWDVPRFAEYHGYNIIIVENVVDARKWVMWDAWLMAMHSLGYVHKCCYFNSMHFHPTPQSRDRMYVVFWKKANKAPNLEYMPRAHCASCGHDVDAVQTWKKNRFGKYKTQYIYKCPVHNTDVTPYYYAAFNAIDWTDPGTRIGDRDKPLSDNTTRRIQYGLDKYGIDPYIIHAAYGAEARGTERSMTDPFFTQTTFTTQAAVFPFMVNDQHSTGIECRIRSTGQAVQTVSTMPHLKLVMPFIIKGEHTMQKGYVKSSSDAFQTQTVRQSMSVITPPFIVENKGQSNARDIKSPLATMTTKDFHGIITSEAWNTFIGYYYGNAQTSHISEALDTMSTRDRGYLINYTKPRIEDCYYRMIKPPEVKRAMAFDDDYVILGSGKDQVKQCGNAVTPPVMEWLISQCVKSLS